MQKTARTLLIALVTTMSASLAAAPIGYSINSDSPTGNADSLYRIDLGTGAETRIAKVTSQGQTRLDVEGLAFAPDGTLYGADDDALTLFALNPDNALVQPASEFLIKGLPIGGSNDFGMTFACDGTLYLTSIAKGSLYRVDLAGNTTVVGAAGSLNPVKISGLAAYGNQLYGLGDGADSTGNATTRNLYLIDTTNGTASVVGPLGAAAGPYLQGGLSFDDSGQLWAITEGAQFGWASQVMKIDRNTGTASAVKALAETGFESLAISAPRGCSGDGNSIVTVVTEWFFNHDEVTDGEVSVDLFCRGIHDGDGQLVGDTMTWTWLLNSQGGPVSATVYPRFDGATECRTEISSPLSAVESASTCSEWTPVALGAGALTCTVTNTVFFEGIPALGPFALLLASLLLLTTGLLATRRF